MRNEEDLTVEDIEDDAYWDGYQDCLKRVLLELDGGDSLLAIREKVSKLIRES